MALPLVILGSARRDGDTAKAIALTFPPGSAEIVMLPDYRIGGYDYAHANADDDFAAIAAAMHKMDQIVFATPVYWYAMSAPLKFLFDRLTDLTENLKPTGKALAGKSVWLIATGTDPELPEGFEVPFRRTAEYFDMTYRGSAYLHTGGDATLRATHEAALTAFGAQILDPKQ
jgi:multimeric flavodoxin WrbA